MALQIVTVRSISSWDTMAIPILVVDDSAVSRRIVIRALPPGWDVIVTQAANGSEALAALSDKPHAVVLLDLNMPIMDGYEFLEALSAREISVAAAAAAAPDAAIGAPVPRPIIIVLSGDVQPQARARVTALGARAFVKKPVRAESILDALKECGVL
jgi:two-component system, chemotaxis family, chemotaxis protein CheY